MNDILSGHVVGFLRFALPIAGYVVAYPLFIAEHGLTIFALWSLITSVSYAVSVSDLGFSDHLTRMLARSSGVEEIAAAKRVARMARRCAAAMSLALVVLIASADALTSFTATSVYPRSGLAAACALVALAAACAVQNRISEAPLRSFHRNDIVQAYQLWRQLLAIGGLLLSVVVDTPLETFALATLVAELIQAFLLRRTVRRLFPAWADSPAAGASKPTFAEAFAVMRETFPLYALSLAMVARDPLLRLVLAARFGLTIAAAYEIAYRVGITCFNAATVGASTFLPNLARRLEQDGSLSAMRLFAALTGLMCGLSVAIFGAALGAADHLLPLWIEDVTPLALTLTTVMVLWLWSNAVVVPAWSLALARHLERIPIATVLMQFGSIFVLLAVGLDIAEFLIAWLVLGLMTMSLMVAWIGRHVPVVSGFLAARAMALLIAISALLILGYGATKLGDGATVAADAGFAAVSVILGALLAGVSIRRLRAESVMN